ncbi:MAG: aldo/keto reductase [Anaerolineaceae bacterium]|nr:aldo/keto reductase [Anaerolineaceae bacterium]
MRTIPLPHTDLTVTSICLGSAEFGGMIDRATSEQLLDAYLDAGGNFIDTARVYNNWIPGEKNRAEKLIGAWMQARGNRHQIVLASKGGHPNLEAMLVGRLSRDEILGDLEGSLRDLQTDVIDLYWVHRDDQSRPVADILSTLEEAVQAGKIRYYAASNWGAERMQEAQDYAQSTGLRGFVATQVLWNAAVMERAKVPDTTIELMTPALYEFHRKSVLAAIPYSSQANGLFTRMANGTLDGMNPGQRQGYPEEANRRRFAVMQRIMAEQGLSVTQVGLGYLLSQPFPVTPIVGCRNLTQLMDSLTAADVRLSPEQVEEIAAIL